MEETCDETDQSTVEEEPLAALVGLVERLREEVEELQERWEALERWEELGEELEATRLRLRVAEATVELLLERRRQEEVAQEEKGGAEGGGAMRAEDEESVSAQASVGVRSEAFGGDVLTRRSRVLEQPPAGSSAGGKRPRPAAPGDRGGEGEGPRLSLVTALPLSVWQEHLRPMLSVGEAAGLRRVCKALRALVRDWPMRLGDLDKKKLEAALTCFPATESFEGSLGEPLEAAEESRLVEVLGGGTLKRIKVEGVGGERLLSSAVRAGALPNLTYFHFSLKHPTHREILSGGMLPLLEEVDVRVWGEGDLEGQVAALEPLSRLKHLRRLTVTCHEAGEAAFPPFIPPSLETLSLDIGRMEIFESLLPALPSTLKDSGASLQEFSLTISDELSAECGAVLAQVLRRCSSTLKTVALHDHQPEGVLGTACIPGFVVGLMSCCDTLEVLHCPWAVFSAFPATCPTFRRLAALHVQGGDIDSEDIDLASPAWDIMANGRLPALASLTIETLRAFSLGERVEGEGGGRLARAFEAVAGTLRRLTLLRDFGVLKARLPAGTSYELGAAIGKLRRLSFLHLQFKHGRDYHAVGRGMAASGGCPELFEVKLSGLQRTLHWLTFEPSLIVPSVRSLHLFCRCGTEEEALLLCCGLVQVGYKHRLTVDLYDRDICGLSYMKL
jgi:hypothetical protein